MRVWVRYFALGDTTVTSFSKPAAAFNEEGINDFAN